MSTEAERDTESVHALDHEPVCGYSVHAGDAPATLAVWYRPFPGCGHHVTDFLFFCASCWNYRCADGRVHCSTCGHQARAMATILRMETLR